MTKEEIKRAWEKADALALKIWEAFCTLTASEEAKRAQAELKKWLDFVRANGLVYNGNLDCYITMHLWG